MSEAKQPHDDHAHGSPYVQHHYDDAQHQFDSGKLGIWLILVQEVLFFSALFLAYVLYRSHHPEIFAYAHSYLDVQFGAINTGVLIFSSLTAAWAVRCAQLGQRRGLIACLSITLVCAFAFLGIKYVEYTHKIHEHILFGGRFDPCVAPSGRELVTRSNDCAGTKSSVQYDPSTSDFVANQTVAKYSPGCFGADHDVDLEEPGVQIDCKTVTESTFTLTRGADGKDVKKETGTRAIPECPELPLGLDGQKGEPAAEPKFPCWEPQVNPNVCPSSVAVIVLYGDHTKRPNVDIKAECEPAAKAVEVADVFADPDHPVVLGKATVQPIVHKTKHELNHELANGPPPPNTSMFFSIYFAMTGLHGIHVLIGIFIFIWLLIRAVKGQFTPDYFGPIDYAALYWHIVDLVWIFLFPLLYLIH